MSKVRSYDEGYESALFEEEAIRECGAENRRKQSKLFPSSDCITHCRGRDGFKKQERRFKSIDGFYEPRNHYVFKPVGSLVC